MNAAKSYGGFLGITDGPQIQADNANPYLYEQGQRNTLFTNPTYNNMLQQYAGGGQTNQQALQGIQGSGLNDFQKSEAMKDITVNPLTGSQFATQEVQNNPILGQLYGQNGLMGQEIGKEQQLQNQGFQLTPEDRTMYGQVSGDIARQFGQQGNDTANNLAMRGMSQSGAAGAAFSGLGGSQNEMLQQAQQQIMQQRFQNTQQQIAQQQGFINSLGAQGSTAINQQFGRQQAGANQQTQTLQNNTNQQMAQNTGANQANLAAQNFNVDNQPMNFVDVMNGGVASAVGAGSKTGGQQVGAGATQGLMTKAPAGAAAAPAGGAAALA